MLVLNKIKTNYKVCSRYIIGDENGYRGQVETGTSVLPVCGSYLQSAWVSQMVMFSIPFKFIPLTLFLAKGWLPILSSHRLTLTHSLKNFSD